MRLTNLRLCPAGNGKCFYIPKAKMSDNQIGEYFDLVITPHAEPNSSIRSRLLNLMNDGNTWQLADLATEVSTVNQDYDTVVNFVEAILENIPEISKVGDFEYGLAQASID